MKTTKTRMRVSGFLAAAALASAAATGAWAESDWMKDLHIEQRAMAELQPTPASARPAGAAAASGLAVEAAVDRADGRYEQGERLTLTIDTSEDSYVWVFDTGTSGKVHQLFPNRYEDDNFVRAGTPLTLPQAGSDYDIMVSHPPGAELLTVVASRDSTPPAPDAIDRETAAGPFFALRESAVSVAKDLSISLRERPSDYAVAHRVIHVR